MAGTLFIVSAPSGAGKTTLVQGLLEQDCSICLSVSYTTRQPRSGEVDGLAYHFVAAQRFAALRDRGDLLEWAQVHGNYYGTSRQWVEQQIAAGMDLLLEIDWQGAQQVRQTFPEAISIFVLPPSLATLEERLRFRSTDSQEVIALRLQAALAEMRHVNEFDYVIINDKLEKAVAELVVIVRSLRLRYANQLAASPGLFTFLE